MTLAVDSSFGARTRMSISMPCCDSNWRRIFAEVSQLSVDESDHGRRYKPFDELHTKVTFLDDFQKIVIVDGNSKPRR